MNRHRTNRELLLIAAQAMGWDTTHSHNNLRLKLDPPCDALHVRRRDKGELVTVTTAWNPLDKTSATAGSQALELAAHFRISTGYDDRFRQFGECAYATYRTGRYSCNSTMVNVKEAGGRDAAMCRAIVGAVVAQFEAGQC